MDTNRINEIAELQILRELLGAVGSVEIACASLTPHAHQGPTMITIAPTFVNDFKRKYLKGVDLSDALAQTHAWLKKQGRIPWNPSPDDPDEETGFASVGRDRR